MISKKSIGQIAAEDYRTVQIFKKHNSNFYFQENRSIKEVAVTRKLDAKLLLDEIEAVQKVESEENINFISWPLDLLIDYIEKKHHRFVKKNSSIVKTQLEKLSETNGEKHPELLAVSDQFNHSIRELSSHMKNEELFLFPEVRKMIRAKHSEVKLTKNHFGSLQNPR